MAVGNVREGTPREGRRWQFGWCEFVEMSRQLSVHRLPVKIEAKPIDVLMLLLEQPIGVHTKDELLGVCWPNSRDGASDASLTTAIRKLRLAFGGAREEIILTVPNVGYRMAVPVLETIVATPQELIFHLEPGDAIPRRLHWQAQRPLDAAQSVWLGEQIKTHEVRVFKFALDGVRLRALQREVTLSRLLQKSLADTSSFVRVIDWDFEEKPYFTESEYGGVNLLEFAETGHFKQLTFEGRVMLAAGVVETVAAAHSLGILHNDLKPSNILILEPTDDSAPGNGQPHPRNLEIRVADFGVASLTQPERLRQMEITQHGFAEGNQPLGSPVGTGIYRAPEVLAGAPPSTVADVYALGVMLYQIACGDFIEPLSPGWESRIADPLLRDDIAVAANVDPAQRIATALDLAIRLRTIEARRADQAMHAAEAVRREQERRELERARERRPWIAFALLALTLGLCASLWFGRRAELARNAAVEDAAHARRLEKFTEGLLTAGEDRVPKKDLTVEGLLERGVKSAQALNTNCGERAEMLHTLGMVYDDLGLFDKAQDLLQEALQEREQVFGVNSAEAASTLTELSALFGDRGQNNEALKLAQRAVDMDTLLLPQDDPRILHAKTRLGMAVMELGQYDKARLIFMAVVEQERGRPDLLADLSDTLGGLTTTEIYLGHRKDALRLADEGLAIDRQRLGDKHPDVASGLIDKAQIENTNGDYAKSEADAREALAIERGWLPPGHYEIASAETTLADPLSNQGKTQEALALLTDALSIQQAKFSFPDRRTAHTLVALGTTERSLNHLDTALVYYQRAAAQYRALVPGSKDERLGLVLYNEGRVMFAQMKLSQAETLLQEAVQIDVDHLPADDIRSIDARIALGQVLAAENRPEQARPLLAEAFKQASAGDPHLSRERDAASEALLNLGKQPGAAAQPPTSNRAAKLQMPLSPQKKR